MSESMESRSPNPFGAEWSKKKRALMRAKGRCINDTMKASHPLPEKGECRCAPCKLVHKVGSAKARQILGEAWGKLGWRPAAGNVSR